MIESGWTQSELSQRTGAAETARLSERLASSPLFSVLFSLIDGCVAVLDSNRQFVAASQGLLDALGLRLEDVLGRRHGELFGCVYAERGSAGCGTSEHCRHCGALDTLLRCRGQDAPLEGECTLQLGSDDGRQSLKLDLQAVSTRLSGTEFVILKMQRADGLGLDEDGWPLALTEFLRADVLGVGGMGTVFLVEDSAKTLYALKTLRASVATERGMLDRFVREAELSAGLDHPHVLRTYTHGETSDGYLYLLSEFCEGGTVSSYRQDYGAVSPEQAMAWMRQAVLGLTYLWEQHGVVHRDIKPDNLLLDACGQVKIADFGVAYRPSHDADASARGVVEGTPLYLSPEQAWGERLDVRSDLYSLGVTIYDLLAGRPPFRGRDATTLLTAHRFQPAPALRARKSAWLPPGLAELIHDLLAKVPAQRPSPSDVLARLDRIAEENGFDLHARTPLAPPSRALPLAEEDCDPMGETLATNSPRAETTLAS